MNAVLDSAPPTPATPFASAADLRAAHTVLLERHDQEDDQDSFWDDVVQFVRDGAATGVILTGEDRTEIQKILSSWGATLFSERRTEVEALLAKFDAEKLPVFPDDLCPYVGLDAFREEQRDAFFGRTELIEECLRSLRASRVVVVVGPSGSGKSSLVMAGLLPRLRSQAELDNTPIRLVGPVLPGGEALANLTCSLMGSDAAVPVLPALQSGATKLADTLSSKEPVCVILDQFEEVFTLSPSEDAAHTFLDQLVSLVTAPHLQVSVILTMRTEFEDYAAKHEAFFRLFSQARVQVRPLTAGQLRDAIVAPANGIGEALAERTGRDADRSARLEISPDVVDALVREILGEPGGLPLMQFALRKLWDYRDRNRITMAAYRRIGSARTALAKFAEAFYADRLDEAERRCARRILLKMVRVGEGLERYSSRVLRERLFDGGEPRERIEDVLRKLMDEGLVRATGAECVEVAHEALVRNWPRLEEWLKEDRDALLTRRRFEEMAREWVRLQRGTSGLLDRRQLEDAEAWIKSEKSLEYGRTPELLDLVEASRQQLVAEEQRALAEKQAEAERLEAAKQQKRFRKIAAGVIALVFVLGYFVLENINLEQRKKAVRDAEDAAKRQSDTMIAEAQEKQAKAEASRIEAEKLLADAKRSIAKEREAWEMERARSQEEKARIDEERKAAEVEIAERQQEVARAQQQLTRAQQLQAEIEAQRLKLTAELNSLSQRTRAEAEQNLRGRIKRVSIEYFPHELEASTKPGGAKAIAALTKAGFTLKPVASSSTPPAGAIVLAKGEGVDDDVVAMITAALKAAGLPVEKTTTLESSPRTVRVCTEANLSAPAAGAEAKPWTILVRKIYGKEKDALQAAALLEQKGLASTEVIRTKEREWRVVFGRYATEQEANTARDVLNGIGGLQGVLGWGGASRPKPFVVEISSLPRFQP